MLAQLLPAIFALIGKLIPDPAAQADAQLKIMAMAQNGELAQLTAATQLAQGQIDVNKADSAGQSAMQRNWRPFIGWVCGAALAFDTIAKPVIIMAWVMAGHNAPVMPNLSTEQLYGLLFGLLGLGSLRTIEKVKA
jgi:Holin of 3TMs, for gene-transfer release